MNTLEPNAELPSRATSGSIGYDLSTIEKVSIETNETQLVRTGIKLAKDMPYALDAIAPSGLAMFILPRSSLILRYGLIVGNSPGVIDPDYTEEIKVILYKLPVKNIPDLITLEAGTRVAQAVFVNCFFPWLTYTEEENIFRDKRGGFGSTGE
jgi:dUTP pyrophosphatase